MADPRPKRVFPLGLLQETPLFRQLPLGERQSLIRLLTPVSFAAGEVIVGEGEGETDLFLIVTGQARASGTNLVGQRILLYHLGPGDAVGEGALARHHVLSPAVEAVTDMLAFRIKHDDYTRIRESCPDFCQRLEEYAALQGRKAFLREKSVFARLDAQQLQNVAEKLVSEEFPAGWDVVVEGEPGDRFYLVCSGQLQCFRWGRVVALFEVGDFFGETALIAAVPRTATVSTTRPSALLSLTKTAFNDLIVHDPTIRHIFGEMMRIRFTDEVADHLLAADPEPQPKPAFHRVMTERYWKLLTMGGSVFVALSLLMLLLQWKWLILPTIFVGALTGPVVYVVYLAETDILNKSPTVLVGIFVVSGVLGLVISGLLHHLTGARIGNLWNGLHIGLIEELAKMAAVMILLLRKNSRFEMDGILYGAAAGMGFAAIENMLHGWADRNTIPVLLSTLWARTILAPFGHGTWTAIACAGLWRLRTHTRSARRWLEFLGGLAISVFLHGAWDWPWIRGTLALPWFLFLGAIGLWILRFMVNRATEGELEALLNLNPDIAAATETAVQARCSNCDELAPRGARFCPRCGIALRIK